MKLSVTSVMLPRWDLNQTFDKLAEHGYEGIELRPKALSTSSVVRIVLTKSGEPPFYLKPSGASSPIELSNSSGLSMRTLPAVEGRGVSNW